MRRILRTDDESSLDSRSITLAASTAKRMRLATTTTTTTSWSGDDDVASSSASEDRQIDETDGRFVTVEQARRALEYYAADAATRERDPEKYADAYAEGVRAIQACARRRYDALVSDPSWSDSSLRLFRAIQHGTPVSYARLRDVETRVTSAAAPRSKKKKNDRSNDDLRPLDLARRNAPLEIDAGSCVVVKVRANSRYYWEMERDLYEYGLENDLDGTTTADPGTAREFDERFFAASRHADLGAVEVRVRRLEGGKCVDAYVRPVELFVIDGGAQRAFVQNMYEMFAWHWTVQNRWATSWRVADDADARDLVALKYVEKLNLHLKTHDALSRIVDAIYTESSRSSKDMSFFGKFAKNIGPPRPPTAAEGTAVADRPSTGPKKPSSKLAKVGAQRRTHDAKKVVADQPTRQILAEKAAAGIDAADEKTKTRPTVDGDGDVTVGVDAREASPPPPTEPKKKKKRPTAFERFYAKHKTPDTKKTYLQQRWREMTDEEKREYGAIVLGGGGGGGDGKKRKRKSDGPLAVAADPPTTTRVDIVGPAVGPDDIDDIDDIEDPDDEEKKDADLSPPTTKRQKKDGRPRDVVPRETVLGPSALASVPAAADKSLAGRLREHFERSADVPDDVAFVWRLFSDNLDKTTRRPRARRTTFASTPFADARAKTTTVEGAMRALRDVEGIGIAFKAFNLLFGTVFGAERDDEEEDDVVFA